MQIYYYPQRSSAVN